MSTVRQQQFDNALKDNDLLYELYVQHVKNELRDRLKPIADKILDECVEEAAKSMQGHIESVYSAFDYGHTFRVILENKK